MALSEQEKRSEAFQRGLGKSTAEIEATRRKLASRPLPQENSSYKSSKQSSPGDTPDLRGGVENNYAAQLAQIRTLEGVYKDIESLRTEGQSFGHPSYFKYFICGSLALLKDGLDIAVLLTVIAVPWWWLVGPSISILVIIIFWFFDVKQKKAKEYMKNLEQNMEVIQANIVHAVRIASIVPGVKKRVARFGIVKIASFVGRNPTVTVAIGGGLETIPLVSLVPWNTIAVILSYLDERKIYVNAARNAEEAHSQLSSQLINAA